MKTLNGKTHKEICVGEFKRWTQQFSIPVMCNGLTEKRVDDERFDKWIQWKDREFIGNTILCKSTSMELFQLGNSMLGYNALFLIMSEKSTNLLGVIVAGKVIDMVRKIGMFNGIPVTKIIKSNSENMDYMLEF